MTRMKRSRSYYYRRNIIDTVLVTIIVALFLVIIFLSFKLFAKNKTTSIPKNVSQSSAESSSIPTSETESCTTSESACCNCSSCTCSCNDLSGSNALESKSVTSQSITSENSQNMMFGVPLPEQPEVGNSYFDDAMFVGDSITNGIQIYSIMKNATVISSVGINPVSIHTSEVIKSGNKKITFLQAMKQYKPKKIYIMLGSNGLAFQTQSALIKGYGEFVDKVKKQHSGSIIYIQSILPVTAEKEKKDKRYANSKIDAINQALLKMAKEKQVYYLDVAQVFKGADGAMPKEAAPNDGMHFGVKYYNLWFEYLRKHAISVDNTTSSAASSSKN